MGCSCTTAASVTASGAASGWPRRGQSEAVFFPDEQLPCHSFLDGKPCTRKKCDFAHQGTGLSRLLMLLAHTRRRLDVAMFSIEQEELTVALQEANGRGVAVRIITDDEQAKGKSSKVGRLREAGLALRTDASKKLHMHHKFVIIDGILLVSGSFNWTCSAVRRNNENIVISHVPALASTFEQEFNRLWTDFGAGLSRPAPSTATVKGTTTALFFPDVGSANLGVLKKELQTARKSVDVAMFTLTLDVLVDILIAHHNSGLRIRVITDNRQAACRGADAERLAAAGVPVRTDSSRFAMHHKFAIIDGVTLLNGSFNWTAQAANGNQESVVVYRPAGSLAASFAQEFDCLWDKFA